MRLLGELASGDGSPQAPSGLALAEWIRLGCDELRTWYLECAQGQPARGRPAELSRWFWRDTAAARLIGAAAAALLEHSAPVVRMLALRALVPREHFDELLGGAQSA